MEVWIFSYNRGKFLQNCVQSLEKCAPFLHVSVFDDQSDDPQTQAVLETIARRHRVVIADQEMLGSKHGGLYGNMQALIDGSVGSRSDTVCCIQDDTQFVRAIDESEVDELNALLESRPKLGFIRPTFMRGCNAPEDTKRTRFDVGVNGYYVDRYNRSAGAFYSDLFVAKLSRLRASGWHFADRESGNEARARDLFEQMVYLRDPFVAWLPNVPAFRGKRQTWAMKVAQKQMGPDYCPIAILTPDEALALRNRPETQLPFAEDFLKVNLDQQVKVPWRYYPLQGRRWLKRLNQLELAFLKA